MRVLLLSRNLRQADFIHRGLRNDGLTVDVMGATEKRWVEEQAGFSDGIFLLSDDEAWLTAQSMVCRDIKKRIPVMALVTVHGPQLAKLYEAGLIDNFFVRPFPFYRIAAEMKYAIFRLKELIDSSQYAVRDLALDVLKREVKCKGVPIALRNREFALLHFLMSNPGRLLSRSMILENVWDHNADVMTNTVDVHVSNLRKKITAVANDTYIHTIPCNGYIFQ